MRLWIDAHLSPSIAAWINRTFSGVRAESLRSLGMVRASDRAIFDAAREARAVVMTKDADFSNLVDRDGVPPHILWVTCGNTSNARMKEVLSCSLERALDMIRRGEAVVEISDRHLHS